MFFFLFAKSVCNLPHQRHVINRLFNQQLLFVKVPQTWDIFLSNMSPVFNRSCSEWWNEVENDTEETMMHLPHRKNLDTLRWRLVQKTIKIVEIFNAKWDVFPGDVNDVYCTGRIIILFAYLRYFNCYICYCMMIDPVAKQPATCLEPAGKIWLSIWLDMK
jgi:hypothetical protein